MEHTPNTVQTFAPDIPQIDSAARTTPKLSAGPCVSFAGVQVPDPGREKLEELGGGVFAGVGQDRGHGVGGAQGQCVHSRASANLARTRRDEKDGPACQSLGALAAGPSLSLHRVYKLTWTVKSE